MGNPHRFFGDSKPIDLEGGGALPARCPVEVTFRVHQEQFLLRPSDALNAIVLACLGRVLARYPELDIYVFSFESNHGSFVCRPPNPWILSSFMRDFMSVLATRINGHRDREGTFWQRRYRAIPILDDAKLEERFAYCLLQGTKENLVASAREWPGVSAVAQLMGGPELVGRWRDGTREYELRRQRNRKIQRAAKRGVELELPEVPDVWIEYPIRLAPLSHWAELRPGQLRAKVTAIVHADERATKARHQRDGTQPLGVARVLATDPFARPAAPKKSPAPACHTTDPVLRRGFLQARKRFVEALRSVATRVEELLPTLGVMLGVTLPPLAHKPARPLAVLATRQPAAAA